MKNLLPVIFSIIFLLSCGNAPNADTTLPFQNTDNNQSFMEKFLPSNSESSFLMVKDTTRKIAYHYEQPTETIALPLSLLEISGLSYYPPKDQLLAVNDERGWIFFLNKKTGEVEDKRTFSGNGDFEGVESVGDKIAMVKSKGDVYLYDPLKDEKVDAMKTDLNSSNDVEGLAYDVEKGELLLACKGNPNVGDSDKYKKLRNVYRFDLKKEKLEKKPLLSISDDDIEDFVKETLEAKDFSKKEIKKKRKRANDFSPSGIAIHPITQNYYLISSIGKLLIVVNQEEDIVELVFLDEKIHRQPEGICFTPNGDLFISNEGKGLGAKLMRYDFLK